MKNFKRVFLLMLSVMAIAAIALSAASCGKKKATESVAPGETAVSGTYGAGEQSFKFEVTDDQGKVTKFDILYGEEKTVGEALVKTGLISGDESEYGLYVKVVNGLEADYEKDGAYWGFFIDGAFAETGVDSTPIEDGKTYAFIYSR